MKKITLLITALLTFVMVSYGQVSYEFGWEPSTAPMGGWTSVGTAGSFSRSTASPCAGSASARVNVYYGLNATLTSPSLGTSNGGLVDFSFDYKAVDYYNTSAGVPAEDFSINVEWSNSLTGPWTNLGIIDAETHEVSGTCATVNYNFIAFPGDVFVRIKAQSGADADMFIYIDNVVVSQGATPTCISPSTLSISNLASSGATITWGEPSAAPELGYEYYYSDISGTPTVAGTATTSLTANLTALSPNTKYYVYVRSMCSGEQSAWYGPNVILTPCEGFSVPFLETFNSDSDTKACWTVVNANGDAAQWNTSYASNPINGNQSAVMITDYLAGANDDWLISPKITLTGNERLKFKYKAQSSFEPNDFAVKLSTTGNSPADFTTVLMPLMEVSNTVAETKAISLTSYTGDVYIAFHVPPGGLDGYRLFIDDVLVELSPVDAPACIEDMNAVTNEGCGNFPTVFTWAAVPSTDGYKVSIGTSPDGEDLIVDNEDIGESLTYSFVGNPGTEYFYTIKPYAGDLLAVDCYEDSFTTYDDGCYCETAPQYLDGQGISNVQIGDTDYIVNPVSYMNLNENGAIEVTQGINNVMNITFKTGYTYNTNIWIDYNDNYTFEPSELVFVGESEAPNPTVLNTTFFLPATVSLGEHQMRIVATDNLQNPANPCYNGGYGIVIDLLVDVQEAPDCLPPTASAASNITANTAQLNWESTGTLFNVEVLFAGEAQGAGIITEGVAANTLALTELDAQADYAYYLQTDCGDGLSPWTGPFLFRTGCESFDDFIEDFTTDVNYDAPECWYTIKESTDQYSYVRTYSYNDYMQFYTAGDAAANLYLITPSLTDLPLETHRIKFRAYSPTVGQSVIIGTMSDPADSDSFTAVQTIPLTTSYADYAVAFLTETTDMHVAFKFVGTANYQYLYLDDVIWETAPSCPDIYVVSFDGATPYTADISWTPGGAETAWQYAYGAADLTDPSGLTTYDVATTAFTTITDLTPSTSYKVWVRAACGEGFGTWSPGKAFVTACIAVTEFPWTEGFENITMVGTSAFPPCWIKENGDYATADVGATSYTTPRSGSNYLRNNWSAINEFMWTPGFDLVAGTSYDFSFYVQGDGYAGWNIDVFHNTVQNSAGATQLGTTHTASGPGSLSLQPYELVANTFVPSTSGTYYFAVRTNQSSSSPWYIGFDDFRMEPTPTCAAPLAPTSSDITVSTATLNWTETTPAPAGGYDYYVTSNLTSTPTPTTVPTGTVGAGITTAALTDLSGATVYRSYVRSICAADEKSSWSDAGTFFTDCINATLPYTIDFEDVTIPGLPLCTTSENVGFGNNWETRNAIGNGFTGKILSYSYSFDPADAWFYTNTVSLVAGTTYSVSYDYGNNFSMYTESMRVAYGTTANSTAMTTEIADHPTINQETLQENVATFTPATSGDYVIGFNVYSEDFQDYLFLDNIVIQEVLGAADFQNNSFTAYPNPVKDMLNVSFTQNISDITVYNLLGQKVLFMNMNANKGQVDMSTLAAGTYLVKVNTANGVNTIKVIKE